MTQLIKVLKSRQFWTIVALFILNGFEGVKELVPVSALPYVNGLLSLIALYFRVSAKQKF